MKRLLALLPFLLLNHSQAAGTPIKTLITGSGGRLTINDNVFVVSKRTRDLTYLNLGVGVREVVSGKIKGLSMFAFKEYLKPAELELLISNTGRAATSCFNISNERLSAIGYWLTLQNKTAVRDVSNEFGPMRLEFV